MIHYITDDLDDDFRTFVACGLHRLQQFLACYAEFERRYGR